MESKVSLPGAKFNVRVPHFALSDAQYSLHTAPPQPTDKNEQPDMLRSVSLFDSGQGGGQTMGRKEDRNRNERTNANEGSAATAICQREDSKAKTTRTDRATTTNARSPY